MRVNLGIRRRLAPLLQNHRQKIELMHGLLCSLPGTPVLYYGDEIGMGDNVYLGDRDSVRTPMQWSADRNAGFSSANPQRLFLPVVIDPEYHYETVNVEAQHHNPQSLLWWVRRLLALRKRHAVFGRGRLEMLHPDNPSVLAFVRRDDDTQILVVANLSRFAQFAELDLGEYRGMTPVELFGRTEFPLVGELPYLVTLGPYAFYWLELTDARVRRADDQPVELRTDGAWTSLLERPAIHQLERALPQLLRTRRWFGAKNRRISRARVEDVAAVDGAAGSVVTVVHVEFADGDVDRFLLPMGFVTDTDADWLRDQPQAVLARVHGADGDGWLIDAHWDHDYAPRPARRHPTSPPARWPPRQHRRPQHERTRRDRPRRPGPHDHRERRRAVEHLGPVRRSLRAQDLPAHRHRRQPRARAGLVPHPASVRRGAGGGRRPRVPEPRERSQRGGRVDRGAARVRPQRG